MPAVVSSDAAAFFAHLKKKIRMATHVLERREQLRPVLRAAVDAEALKRGASLEEVSRLHDELTRGAPVLERLLADRVAGRFPAEEVDMQDWRDMLKRSQASASACGGAVDREAASPSARAGTMMAAIRTKFEVAPPNEAGGCWKELPETLAKKKAIWNPQNEDHRCFVWRVLAHCLGVEGLTWQERQKTLLLLPRDDPPRTPPSGLAARSGRRGGGLLWPADGPPRELRRHRPSSSATPGGWRSSSSCGSRCGRTGWSTTTSSSSAPRAARASSGTPCCFSCLEVYSTPDGPHSAAAAGAPDRRGLFLLRGRWPMRLRATRGAEARTTSGTATSTTPSAC